MSTKNHFRANSQEKLANKIAYLEQNALPGIQHFEKYQNYTTEWNFENDDDDAQQQQEVDIYLSEDLRYLLEQIIDMRDEEAKLTKDIDQISQNLAQLQQRIMQKGVRGKKLREISRKKGPYGYLQPKRPHSWDGRRAIKDYEDMRNENLLLTQILNETDLLLTSRLSGKGEYPAGYLQKLMEYLRIRKGYNLHDNLNKIEKLKKMVLVLMSQKGCTLSPDGQALTLIPMEVMKPIENGVAKLETVGTVEAEKAANLLMALMGSIKIIELIMLRSEHAISQRSFDVLTSTLLRLMAIHPSIKEVLRDILDQVRIFGYGALRQ